MAEGSFAQAHSNALRLVLLGASLAVAWAVVSAIAAPGSASAVEPGSDGGSVAVAVVDDVLDVLPVATAVASAPAASTPAPADADSTERPASPADTTVAPVVEVVVPVTEPVEPVQEPAAPVAEPAVPVTEPIASVIAEAAPSGRMLATIVEAATTVTTGATGLVGAVTAPLLDTLAPVGELLAAPVALPVVVPPAAEPAPAPAVEPAPAAPRDLPSQASVASGDIRGAAAQDTPAPPAPANRVVPALPAGSAISGGAHGIPTVAAEAGFGALAAPGAAELAIAGLHEAPLSPSPGALDSPPD